MGCVRGPGRDLPVRPLSDQIPTWRVIEDDCRRALARLRTNSLDAVVTDPPWNLGKAYGRHDDAMAPERYVEWLGDVLRSCARLCRGPIVFLPGATNAHLVGHVLAAAGLRPLDQLTWRKPDEEPIVWTGLRKPAAATLRTIDALEPPAGLPEMAGHPCPKPVDLMRVLVAATAPPGGAVLDPFAGTGTTLVAAVKAGRSAIGIEAEARYCAVIRARLGGSLRAGATAGGYAAEED